MEWKLPNTKPLSNKTLEAFWDSFIISGSQHSAGAHTLEHIMNRCEREHIPFRLTAMPGMGYYMEVFKE